MRHRAGTVLLVYAGLTDYLNHRTNWVVFHFFQGIIQNLILTGPTRKEPTKHRLMTIEEIDSDEDYDPNNEK